MRLHTRHMGTRDYTLALGGHLNVITMITHTQCVPTSLNTHLSPEVGTQSVPRIVDITVPTNLCDKKVKKIRILCFYQIHKVVNTLKTKYGIHPYFLKQCPQKQVSPEVGKGEYQCVCQVCRFAFCSLCKSTFHGVSPCVFRPNEVRKLKTEYENGTAAERLFLERRHGKNRIRRMIDDLISEEWLVDNSKTCPRCHTHIQKSEGCNKMHCSKCRTNFCWLCGKILDQQNPYLHFNVWNSPCFNKLFEDVEIDSD